MSQDPQKGVIGTMKRYKLLLWFSTSLNYLFVYDGSFYVVA